MVDLGHSPHWTRHLDWQRLATTSRKTFTRATKTSYHCMLTNQSLFNRLHVVICSTRQLVPSQQNKLTNHCNVISTVSKIFGCCSPCSLHRKFKSHSVHWSGNTVLQGTRAYGKEAPTLLLTDHARQARCDAVNSRYRKFHTDPNTPRPV